MAYFAEIDESNIVVQVLAVSDEDEFRGQEFLANDLGLGGTWIKTSFNTRGGVHYITDTDTPSEDQSKALRKNFAGIGYTYDEGRDAFIPPQDFPSWTLNEDTCLWDSPEPMPEVPVDAEGRHTGGYIWSEDEYNAGNGGWVFLAYEDK